MPTELNKFSEAYATLTVAVYEPLIVKWVSERTLSAISDIIAWRDQKSKDIRLNDGHTTMRALRISKQDMLRPDGKDGRISQSRVQNATAIDNVGNAFNDVTFEKIDLKNYPNAVKISNRIYPFGILNFQPVKMAKANAGFGIKTLPVFFSGNQQRTNPAFDLKAAQRKASELVINAVREATQNNKDIAPFLRDELNKGGLYEFFPAKKIEDGLSPIGISHFYRQLYFNKEEGCGPIEEAFTIAPLETLEVVYETVRRQIYEELVELGSEVVSETAMETKETEEISDKVSSMMQRDTSAAMSVSASGSSGVWTAGASANASLSNSNQRSREEASRRLKEVTKRASERITKSFSVKTRNVDDLTTTNLTRRVIKNESDHPVSYGLRRVLRRVNVKVQDLGPFLVWQLYIRNPGRGLAKGQFVHFRDTGPISVPDVPPGMPARPAGGTETGTTAAEIEGSNPYFITLVIRPGKDRVVTAVSIDNITDLEGGGKSDEVAVPNNDAQNLAPGHDKFWDESTNTFTVSISVRMGDTASVSVNYTYVWEPSQAVLDGWEEERKQKVAEVTQKALNEKFEREKAIITEKSKIRCRPPADLRREERYEVMNRLISNLTFRQDGPFEPTPLEIEYFHRYFDIESMFSYTHPSWWKPRQKGGGLERSPYEITAESEPAPMGSSLGWVIQVDGDSRRNEFLNSPWIRACIPIRPGREKEAIDWLSKHIEGEIGYDVNSGPLKELIDSLARRRNNESLFGLGGPDFVAVDSGLSGDPVEGEPLKPENVFPIIAEFDVTVPTEGFVYDELKVVI